MALAIGGNSINKAYLGSTEIQKMYLGSELVYSGDPEPLQIPTGIQLELIEVDIDIYVSASGSGTEDGLTEENSMGYADARTAISTMQAGETMGFKRGEVFKHTTFLDIDVSGAVGNPITFTAYGSGARPQIDSTDIYTGTWTNQGSNIWTSEASAYNESNPRLKINGNEVLGTKIQAELGTLIPDRVIFWNDDTTDTIHLYSTTDPSLDEVMYMRGSRSVYALLQDNLVFDGLEFIGGYYGALMLAGANNIEVKNCKMGDMCASGVNITDSGVTTCSNITVHDNDMNSSFPFDYRGGTVDDSETTERGSEDGVKVGQCFGGSIYNNTFFDWGHTGVSLTAGSDGEVVNNFTVYNNTFSLSALRDYGGGFTIDRDSSGHEVYNNTMTGCKSNQINGYDNHFHHNDVINTRQTALYTYAEGYGVDMATYAGDVYDNIIEFNNITNAESGAIRLRTSGTRNSGHRIRNNVTENCGSENNNITVELNYGTTGIYDVNFDDNNFYNASETLIYLDADTGDYEDIAFLNASTKYGINANNVNENPVQPSGSKPVLSNFRIESTETSRLYFDASLSVAGMTTTGFSISYRNISGLTIDGDNLGGYFTVTEAFNHFDNNTIRLGEIGDSDVQSLLYNFSLEYIDNQIPEPATSGQTYFVTTVGSSGNNGLTEGTAWDWATAMANVQVGDQVNVKAGDYGPLTSLAPTDSGTPTAPIKFIGYKTTPGDITSMYYTLGDALDPLEMPTFTRTNDLDNQYAFFFESGDNYIILENMQGEGYYSLIRSDDNLGTIIKNSIAYDMFSSGSGRGFRWTAGNYNDGTYTHHNNVKGRAIGCISSNSANTSFGIWASGVLMDGCIAHNDKPNGDVNSTDYFYDIYGSDCIVRNSQALKPIQLQNDKGHGYGVKTNPVYGTVPSIVGHHNLFELNYTYGIREGLQVRNLGADFNVFKDNEAEGYGFNSGDCIAICIWSASTYNLFERNYCHKVQSTMEFYANSENPESEMNQTGNIIKNNIFYDFYDMFRFRNYLTTNLNVTDTLIVNNTFGEGWQYCRTYENYWTFSNNLMSGNIMYNCGKSANPVDDQSNVWFFETVQPFALDYNDFYGAYGALAMATNSILADPQFVDAAGGNFEPTNDALISVSTSVPYDYNDNERNTVTTTIGAIKDTNE